MPRLPTVESFGPRPTPRSQRGVIPFRAGIAESAEARGFRQAAQSAGEISNIALGFAEKFAREDAEREARDLDTQYSSAVRALQLGDGTDANPGFLNLQGQAALDAREAHMRRLEKLQETMLEKASSDRVRSLVSGPFSSRLNSALNSSVVHFGRQRRVANAASFKSHQAAIADDAAVLGAAGDAEGVERLATLAGAQAAAHAEQTGADPAFEAEAAITNILVSEIERRAVSDVDSAREFFEEHRDDIDGRQHTKIEVALARAERQAEIALNEQKRLLAVQVSDAMFVLDRGKTPPELEDLKTAVESIPELAEKLNASIQDAEFMGEFVRSPPAEQATQIERLDDRKTLTKRETVRLEKMARVHNFAIKAIKNDPLAYAEEIEAITDLEELNFSEPATLSRRLTQAQSAAGFFGLETVSPLRPAEADQLTENIDTAEADQVAALFQSLSFGFGRDALDAIADQVASKRPAIAVSLSRAVESPLVASEIVRGDRLVRQTPEVKPTATEIELSVSDTYGSLFREVPSALAPYIDAATAIYAARKVPTGNFEFDETLFEKSLALAAGGEIDGDGEQRGGPIEFNGQKILPPLPGMDEDEFADLVEGLTFEDMERFGNGAPVFGNGQPFTPGLFDAGFFQTDAQLLTIGAGRYRVFQQGLGYVITPEGETYEIDLRRFLFFRGRQ